MIVSPASIQSLPRGKMILLRRMMQAMMRFYLSINSRKVTPMYSKSFGTMNSSASALPSTMR